MSDRTAAGLERELAVLAYVRESPGFGGQRCPQTTGVDQVLDELNSLERSLWESELIPSVQSPGNGHGCIVVVVTGPVADQI